MPVDYRSIESVCFVFLHGIGDFVMFTPALKKIKSINPGIKTTIVIRKELGLKALAEGQGYIDRVLELPLEKHPRFYVPWIFWTKEYWVIKKRLSALLEGRKFGRVRIIYNQLLPTFLYLALCPARARSHKIDALAREAGVLLTQREINTPVLRLPDDAVRQAARGLLARAPAGSFMIGIQRNTMDRTRAVSLAAVQGFINGLNRELGGRIFFVIFANDASFALEQEVDGGHLEAANLLYSFRLDGGRDALSLAALVAGCDIVVSVDSSVFNLACALGKPVIGVFNNYKVRSSQRALESENILCMDSPRASAEELIKKFHALYEGVKREKPRK